MHKNIEELGNYQLWLYHEKIKQKLHELQDIIVQELSNTLGLSLLWKKNTLKDTTVFYQKYKKYLHYLSYELVENFKETYKEEQNIQKEIRNRQKKMLKDIGITKPRLRVKMIAQELQGERLPRFQDIITYIKLHQKNEWDKRPEHKKLFVSQKLAKYFEEQLQISIIDIIKNNWWPTNN